MEKKVEDIYKSLLEELNNHKNKNIDNIILVAIGGRTLNYYLDVKRESDDNDFAYSYVPSESKPGSIFKHTILKALQRVLKIDKIKNALDKDKRFSLNEDKISHYYPKANWIFTVHLYLDGEEYILDFAEDKTISDADFISLVKEENIKTVSVEYTMAAKEIILYKRISDFDYFIEKSYFRHFYDLYRIDSEYEIDENMYLKALKVLVKSDMNNSNEDHRLYIKEKEYVTDQMDFIINRTMPNGKFAKTRLDYIIYEIENTYSVKIDKDKMKEVIFKFSDRIDKTLHQ